jgi:hypothetical protein
MEGGDTRGVAMASGAVPEQAARPAAVVTMARAPAATDRALTRLTRG